MHVCKLISKAAYCHKFKTVIFANKNYDMIGRKQLLKPDLIKHYMWQLIESLDHMHARVITRTHNVLI